MSTITVPNRPFATEPITGLMLPDGIFVSMLGKQAVNAHFVNSGAASVAGATVYVESVSHPGIVITPATHSLGTLASGAARAVGWNADFNACPAGNHHISFVVEQAGIKKRLIKKIFVLGVHFDPGTLTFNAQTPEGIFTARFDDFIRPRHSRCCGGKTKRGASDQPPSSANLINRFASLFQGHEAEFEFCSPGYLPTRVVMGWQPTPAYLGQYSDLPFNDPWWKIVLCIIAVILLIAAAIVEAVSGTGSVTVTAGGGSGPGGGSGCCGVGAAGGGTSYVAAGLVAAAATVATIAGASDVRDPFRRGQDKTPPKEGELTIRESVDAVFSYPEPVALGRPFAVGLKWQYERETNVGNVYTYGTTDVTQNIHVLSKYEIAAADIAYSYARMPWVVQARFFDASGKLLVGSQLFVQCFLIGPHGEWHKFCLQDDGNPPDENPSDGTYTGGFRFTGDNHKGDWTYYVIAQDVNNAQPDLTPEQAAQIIGGMVVTHQLVIDFDEDDCPFVPDGHIKVV